MALQALQQDGAQGPLFACGSPVALAGMGPLARDPPPHLGGSANGWAVTASVPVRSPDGEARCVRSRFVSRTQ